VEANGRPPPGLAGELLDEEDTTPFFAELPVEANGRLEVLGELQDEEETGRALDSREICEA